MADKKETKQETQESQEGFEVVENARGESFVVDGVNYKRLDNQAVYGIKEGRIVANPGGGATAITQASSRVLAARRVALSRAKFADGFARGMLGRDDLSAEAWGAVGERAAELIKSAGSARGFAELARFVGQSAGYTQEDGDKSGDSMAGAAELVRELGKLVESMVGYNKDNSSYLNQSGAAGAGSGGSDGSGGGSAGAGPIVDVPDFE